MANRMSIQWNSVPVPQWHRIEGPECQESGPFGGAVAQIKPSPSSKAAAAACLLPRLRNGFSCGNAPTGDHEFFNSRFLIFGESDLEPTRRHSGTLFLFAEPRRVKPVLFGRRDHPSVMDIRGAAADRRRLGSECDFSREGAWDEDMQGRNEADQCAHAPCLPSLNG